MGGGRREKGRSRGGRGFKADPDDSLCSVRRLGNVSCPLIFFSFFSPGRSAPPGIRREWPLRPRAGCVVCVWREAVGRAAATWWMEETDRWGSVRGGSPPIVVDSDFRRAPASFLRVRPRARACGRAPRLAAARREEDARRFGLAPCSLLVPGVVLCCVMCTKVGRSKTKWDLGWGETRIGERHTPLDDTRWDTRRRLVSLSVSARSYAKVQSNPTGTGTASSLVRCSATSIWQWYGSSFVRCGGVHFPWVNYSIWDTCTVHTCFKYCLRHR